jgi:DNA-directed RNA polymerase II subunit RPB1
VVDPSPYDSNVVRFAVHRGKFTHGKIDKTTLRNESTGLIHAAFNDIGPVATADMIDNMRGLVTHFLLQHGFSVGVSDTFISHAFFAQLAEWKQDTRVQMAQHLKQIHASSEDVHRVITPLFIETIYSGQPLFDKIAEHTKKHISPTNRILQMCLAKSKGSDLNTFQIMSCLGQQMVNGQRVQPGMNRRTLPHFSKDDDRPEARGFVYSSFREGNVETEFWFHAMGGRTGLIDTAVKTSETGYIQRRITKFMEDVSVRYDCTVRDVNHHLIQLQYGNRNIDSARSESNALPLPLDAITEQRPLDIATCVAALYDYTPHTFESHVTDETFARIVREDSLERVERKNVTNQLEMASVYFVTHAAIENSVPSSIWSSVHLKRALDQFFPEDPSRVSDLTPLCIHQDVHRWLLRMNASDCGTLGCKASKLPPALLTPLYQSTVSLLAWGILHPCQQLICQYRVRQKEWNELLESLFQTNLRSKVQPGDMVGGIAAQSIGEPATQLVLNTFHLAGVSQRSVVRGVPRFKELLSLTKEQNKRGRCCIYARHIAMSTVRRCA